MSVVVVFVSLLFSLPHAWQPLFCGEGVFEDGALFDCVRGCLLLQHCLHRFVAPVEANARKHGRERQRGKSNPATNYQKEKNLISNINARRGTLCAIVLLSFQKLVF